MKFLIWFGCIFLGSIIIVLLGYAGYKLGALPYALFVAGEIGLARFLCKKWDERAKKKNKLPF